MRAYEIMKETLLRRRFILIIHLVILALYAVLFLPWLPPAFRMSWPPIMLFGSGCILPLIISAGIFGDDIASGRIAVLVTKPMRAAELYWWRAAGLLAQGAAHFLVAIIILVVFCCMRGRGGLAWARGDLASAFSNMLAAFMLYCSTMALCTTVSVVVKRGFNSVIVFVGFVVIDETLRSLWSQYPEAWLTHWLSQCVKYGCPPVELILTAVREKPLASQLLVGLYTLGLTAAYTGIGIFLLSRRQFPQARD